MKQESLQNSRPITYMINKKVLWMFCYQCGAENPDDAIYCQECGAEIKIYPSNKNRIKREQKRFNEKSPLGAAALNLIIAGAGFVYINEYVKALLSFIMVLIASIISVLLGIPFILGILALIFVMVWSYDETVKYNRRIQEQ